MTLEDLKAKYQELADACEKKGDEYNKQIQDLILKGEDESRYYAKAISEFHKATIYEDIIIDLCQIETTK